MPNLWWELVLVIFHPFQKFRISQIFFIFQEQYRGIKTIVIKSLQLLKALAKGNDLVQRRIYDRMDGLLKVRVVESEAARALREVGNIHHSFVLCSDSMHKFSSFCNAFLRRLLATSQPAWKFSPDSWRSWCGWLDTIRRRFQSCWSFLHALSRSKGLTYPSSETKLTSWSSSCSLTAEQHISLISLERPGGAMAQRWRWGNVIRFVMCCMLYGFRERILTGQEGEKHLMYLTNLVHLLATCAEVWAFSVIEGYHPDWAQVTNNWNDTYYLLTGREPLHWVIVSDHPSSGRDHLGVESHWYLQLHQESLFDLFALGLHEVIC